MAVYVDPPTYYQHTKLHHKTWSHMATDGDVEELHAMAKLIGLKLKWFQADDKRGWSHYDVTPTMRDRAIALGAIPISTKELVQRCFLKKV